MDVKTTFLNGKIE
jgi:hypothetical protein